MSFYEPGLEQSRDNHTAGSQNAQRDEYTGSPTTAQCLACVAVPPIPLGGTATQAMLASEKKIY